VLVFGAYPEEGPPDYLLCLYYSVDYCCLFSDAKMLNGAETTFALSQKGAETCLTVPIR
jgi:hypothetical protein